MTIDNAPRLLKAALAVVDPDTGSVPTVIPFQFNPERLSRTVVARDIDPEGDPQQLVRLSGPPRETYSFEAILDATDALGGKDAEAAANGISAQLAVLERLIAPTKSHIIEADGLADDGALELLPAPPALTLLVWNANRVNAVRLRQFTAQEELFDQNLNPLRARINMTIDILTTDDLGVGTKGGGVYLANLARQESLANAFKPGNSNTPPIGAL